MSKEEYIQFGWGKFIRESLRNEDSQDEGAGFFIYCPQKDSVLLLRRADGSETGHLASPGGHAKVGEKPEKTAQRETLEEIGKDLSGRDYMDKFVNERDDFKYTTFLVEVVDEFEPRLNSEHDAWCWVDLDEIKMCIKKDCKLKSSKFKFPGSRKRSVNAPIHFGIKNCIKHFKL